MKKSNRKSEYSQKLLDPRWQKKRLEILQRDDWTCQRCKDKESTLHVHHRLYFPHKDPWDTDNKYLVTLCAFCHEHETECMPEYIEALSRELKGRLWADDVFHLYDAFSDMNIVKSPSYTSNIIHCVLKNENILKALDDVCFGTKGDK